MFTGNSGFSINNLLAGLFNIDSSTTEAEKTPNDNNAFPHNEVLQCERCKLTFQQFAKVGRFGCSNCYSTFNNQLNPILKRLHSGNTIHAGKIPKRIGGNIHLRKQIEQLKQTLQDHIVSEEFEKAAEVRDQVRTFEKMLSEHREGED